MVRTTDHQLDELEAAMMNIIWQRDDATVREVWTELRTARRITDMTIQTVMTRLAPKGRCCPA